MFKSLDQAVLSGSEILAGRVQPHFKVAHFLRNMPGVIGRGAFIVLEGADRSGKSTQCKLLQTFLAAKGIAASQINFPGRPPESPDARPPASFACAQ
jgi:hypothetical protein